MLKKIIMLLIAVAIPIYSADLKAQQGQLMGEVPITGVKPAEKPAEQKKGSEEKAASSELEATTKNDYGLYTKAGHRSGKWDEFIQPGFQTFDSENLATSGIFLQRAYDQGCRDPLVLFRLAIIRESRGGYAEAAQMLVTTAEGLQGRYPGHPLIKAINKHTARALYSAEKPKEALPYLTEALKLEPDNFMLLFMAGQILHGMGEPDKARVALEKALTIPPPEGTGMGALIPLLHELILVTFELEDAPACAEYLDRLLSIAPGDPFALTYKSKVGNILRSKKEREMIKKLIH